MPTLEQEILDALASAGVPLDCYQLQQVIEAQRQAENRPTRFLFWDLGYGASIDAIRKQCEHMAAAHVIAHESDVPMGVPPRFWYRLPSHD